MQHLVKETLVNAGRNENSSYALIDSQSVKTTAGADSRGYDGGGGTKGRKKHTVTDIIGNIPAVHIHAANIHGTKGGCYVFAKAKKLCPSIKAACADEGYCGTFKRLIEKVFAVRVDISKQIKPKFEVLPKRWWAERTFSWLGHSRRLSKDYEVKTSSEKNMVMISHLHTLLKRL